MNEVYYLWLYSIGYMVMDQLETHFNYFMATFFY